MASALPLAMRRLRRGARVPSLAVVCQERLDRHYTIMHDSVHVAGGYSYLLQDALQLTGPRRPRGSLHAMVYYGTDLT